MSGAEERLNELIREISLPAARAMREEPNAWMFNEDGSAKRLLWCSDSARKGGPCPYKGRPPLGVCCKELQR